MAWRSSDHNYQGGTGTLVIPKPAGTVSGDILILAVTGFFCGFTLPSGFSQLGSDLDVGSPDGQRISVFYKVAGGSEPSSYGLVVNNGFEPCATLHAFSGRDTTSPFTANQPSSNTSSNSSPITLSMTGVTAAAGDDIFIVYAGDTTQSADRWSGAPPAGYTEREDYDPMDWSGIYAHVKENVAAGATGTIQPTLTRTVGSGGAGWLGFVIAIKAAAGSSGAVLESNAADVVTAAGALSTSIKAVAAAVNQVFVTGNMTNGIKFAANAVDNVTATGAPTMQIRINGVAIDVVSATGTMINQILLGSAAVDNVSATVVLTNGIKFAGTAIDNAAATANLTTGTNGSISANAADNVAASGNLSGQIKFNADALVQAIATAALGGGINMAVSAQDIANATAQLSAQIRMLVAAQDNASGSGQLSTQITMAAVAQDSVIATVQMNAQIKFTGSAASIAAAAASLAGSATSFNGNAIDIVNVTAALSTAAALRGNAQDIVTMTVNMTTQIPVTVAALSNALATGSLNASVRFIGFAANDSQASGVLINAALVTPYLIESRAAKVVSIEHLVKKSTTIECGVKIAA